MYATQGYGQNISSVFTVVFLVVVCEMRAWRYRYAVKMPLFVASGADFRHEALIGGVSHQGRVRVSTIRHDESMKTHAFVFMFLQVAAGTVMVLIILGVTCTHGSPLDARFESLQRI